MPVLLYEAGEALRFEETAIRAGIRGIFNVMRHIGMLPARKQSQLVTPIMARSTQWVRAGSSGIVNMKAALGSTVAKGERLATISDPLGDDEESVKAPFDGIVIGRSKSPLAHEGDALIHLGLFKDVPMAADVVDRFTSAHENQPAGA